MSNLLTIPFKKTYQTNVKDAARNYIYAHGGGHPDEFKDDINSWQNMRKDGVGGIVHVDRVNSAILYHAQLVSILSKFPSDIELDIAYAPVFNPSAIPITLRNLVFERCCVLFNLASLYSQLAANEDRSKAEGIKRATANYQFAAGTLVFLRSSVLPKLIYPAGTEDWPLDLSESFVKGLELLMLAQAQECSWQLAKINQYKNGLIAKIAAKIASLYQLASQTIRDASPSIKHMFPSDWLSHMEAKAYHFDAVACYRISVDEASRYGVEIARLQQAQSAAKKAYDIAKRGKIATPVLQDIQSLLGVVQKSLARAERDNDYIYHQDVPAASTLPPVPPANLVSSTIPAGLANPSAVIGSAKHLFGDLMGWGAKEAINIYNDRKANLIKDKVVDFARELQAAADLTLQSLNLPSSLEALEKRVGLPPSLLKKAEEVRLENGPEKIDICIEDIQRLAERDRTLLDEAMDILDNEASEDEAARKKVKLTRPPSFEANVELVEKEKRYRAILTQAALSDETVRRKWDEWERNIVELTWSEEELEASVPVSTITSPARLSAEARQTQIHARALRVLLESLDDVHRSREQLVRRAQNLAAADDIRGRISKVSSGFERLVEVEPAMFEDVLDEELAKYDKFLQDMGEIEQKQKGILSDIESRNTSFLQSRRDDPAVRDREHALQSLDLAYHKYREIMRNLEEGLKFYNDLAAIFLQFKETCKTWSHLRNQEIHSLSRSLQNISLEDDTHERENGKVAIDAVASLASAAAVPQREETPSKEGASKEKVALPALTSSEWDFEEIKLPPGPPRKGR